MTYNETYEKRAREVWFKNHVAKTIPQGEAAGFETIRWKAPDTSNYLISYTLHGLYLFVTGDVGDAVYRFSSPTTFEAIASMNIDYFASKCTASENGRFYESWDGDTVAKRLNEWVADAYEKEEEDERQQKLEGRGEWWNLPDAFGCAHVAEDWHQYLSHHGYDVFGNDWIEFGEIGKVVDVRCIGHLVGIKMAVEQLTAAQNI